MRAVLIHRTLNGAGIWAVKFFGNTHVVIAPTGSDACITILNMFA